MLFDRFEAKEVVERNFFLMIFVSLS